MDTQTRKQVIAQEWMIDPQSPLPMITRLKHRSTYADITLWWLVEQLDLLDKSVSSRQLKKTHFDLL